MKIISFGLFSASWISAVSAVLAVRGPTAIAEFQNNLLNGGHLAVAYARVRKPALDAYFLDRITHYRATVHNYNPNFVLGQNDAPDPHGELNAIFNELPGFVCIFMYSNLQVLDEIKRDFPPTTILQGSILAIIDNVYVGSVADQYRIISGRHGERSFVPYILDLAGLFSLNRAMLDLIPAHRRPVRDTLVPRLVDYQNRITQFHNLIRRYMQMNSLLPYHQILSDLTGLINQIVNGIQTGYTEHQIQEAVTKLVTDLSNTILSMITIIGIVPLVPGQSARTGTVLISKILTEMWSVRRLMGLDLERLSTPLGSWYRKLLSDLRYVLQTIGGQSADWHDWIVQIGPMLDRGETYVTVAFG